MKESKLDGGRTRKYTDLEILLGFKWTIFYHLPSLISHAHHFPFAFLTTVERTASGSSGSGYISISVPGSGFHVLQFVSLGYGDSWDRRRMNE